MFLILQHKLPLMKLPKLERRIFTHQTGYVATNSSTKTIYNLAFSIILRGPISAILPPSRKGSSVDVYNGMSEAFVSIDEVDWPSSNFMWRVQGGIVGLRVSDNKEEKGVEEKRACKVSRADGVGHVQRTVRIICDMYVCCNYSTPLTQEKTRCCRRELKPCSPSSGRETGLRPEVLLDVCLPFKPPHLLPHLIPTNSNYTRLVADRPPLRVRTRQHLSEPLRPKSTTAA